MTDLQLELLRILEAEGGRSPMAVESLAQVLRVTGFSPLPGTPEIEKALAELVIDGWADVVMSPRLGRRFRIRNETQEGEADGQARS